MPRASSDPGDVLRVWYMTTGESGSRQQARGLAHAISPHAVQHEVRVSRVAALAPPALFGVGLLGIASIEGALEPPWPHLLISCGRRSALAALAVRRRARQPMLLVHIQPPGSPARFDLVVAMPHDQIEGPNVLRVETALHSIRPADLQAAASGHDSRFAHLPRPWTGVLLGGATQHTPFTVDDALRLVAQLDVFRAEQGGSLLITPSRRTPPGVVAILQARFRDDSSTFFWQGGMGNPYMTILAQADRLVVTSDSMSMISEALATRAEVRIFSVPGGVRHARFLYNLLEKQWVTPLSGALAAPVRPRPCLDATPIAAAAVRELIAARFGRQDLDQLIHQAG